MKDPLAMWEQCVCEIRAEIRSHDDEDKMRYALSLCNALENSMVQFAKTGETQDIDFEVCFDKVDENESEVIIL
jgi:hypothetical protein